MQGTGVTLAALKEVIEEMHAIGPGPKSRAFNEAVIAEYRASGGRSMGEIPVAAMALVTMTGAKSGTRRTVPIGLEAIDGRLIIVASSGGLPRHPQWFYNLLAHPQVRVERMGETFDATAVVLAGEDRDRIFERLNPIFQQQQAQAGRLFPVIELRPV